MLIISRKPGESFTAGDEIKITILEISGDKIKIGIKAPPDIKIMRTEVIETERSNMDAVLSEGMADLEILKDKLREIGIDKK
ncbi:MAG: carbon storage regulator [Oscillospiraceae bacterium]|nr:carbon storage regulator [Oscillospiraceae bacterium]